MTTEETKTVNIENVAQICHEVNRAYCQAQGDWTQMPWDEAEDWQRESSIAGVVYLLGHPASPAGVLHEQWREHKQADGWVFGQTKDSELKTHPCMVPFDKLPADQKVKDYLFKGVVDGALNGAGIART